MATKPESPDKPATKPKAKKRQASRVAPKVALRPHAHKPNDETRAVVRALIASGQTQAQVIDYLRLMMGFSLSVKTMLRHYRTEIETANSHQVMQVANGIMRKAVGAPAVFDPAGNQIRAEVKPEVTAQIFILKCRGGWVEPQKLEHSGPQGGAIPVNISSLTDTQLEQLLKRLKGG